MARSNAKVSGCLKAAMGVTDAEARKLGDLADKYGTGDITADYVSAVHDILAQTKRLRKSISDAVDKGAKTHTVASLRKVLEDFMGVDSLGRNVKIVASAADLSDVRDLVAFNTENAMAWTRSGKAYLIADRIPVGQERAVFLHEVGGHLGLDRLLPNGMHERLADQVREWAKKDDGSIESKIAKKALARAEAADTEAADLNAEHIGYFLEEAMKAGVEPTALSAEGKNWFRTLWAAFKAAVRKLGFGRGLSAKDVLDMAYGAARLEVNGNWHGTAADFRKFDHAFMGSGEGAQAFSWGGYTADKRGIAKGYMDADTNRKAGAELKINGKTFDMSDPDKAWGPIEDTLLAAYPEVDKRVIARVSELAVHSFNTSKADALRYAKEEFTGKDREDAVRMISSIEYGEAPEGSLLRTDHNVRDSEMLHWEKPLEDQPDVVRKAVDALVSKFSGAGSAWQLGRSDTGRGITFWHKDSPNRVRMALTGQELYNHLEQVLGSDKAASKWLHSQGVKGTKFLDHSSRNGRTVDFTKFPQYDALREAAKADDYFGFDSRSEMLGAILEHADWADRWDAGDNAKLYQEFRDWHIAESNKAPTYNHVLYSDKDMQRAATLPAGDKERVKFSKADTATAQQSTDAYNEASARVRERMEAKAKDSWANVSDFFHKALPWMLSNAQLVEQYGNKIKTLGLYRAIQEKMTKERTDQAQKFHDITVAWDKLDVGVKQRLNAVMMKATLAQIHPDEAFTPGQKDTPNGHLTEADRAKYNELKAMYGALGPEGQKTYQAAKGALQTQWNDRRLAYNDLVNYIYSGRIADALARNDAEAAEKLRIEGEAAEKEYGKQLATLKGPYFPLMRFGSFLAIGESAELKSLKEQAKAATGDERRALEQRIEEMKKDAAHYEVSAHETKGKLNSALRDMANRGLETRADMTDQRLEGASSGSQKILATIGDVVDSAFDAKTAGVLNDALADIYLRSLPEMHALRQEASRKGIAGANPDMLRAFAATGQQSAFYISRLKHTRDLTDTMLKMKAEVKGDINAMHIHREMEQRAALDMQYNETPIQDLIGSASWVYHLGVSPSNLLINSMQPWTVAAPLMAGRHNLGPALRQLGAAYKDVQKVLKDARFKDGKFDPWSGISHESLSNQTERKAIRELMQRGIVDEGLQHELNMFADDKSRWLAKFNRVMGWANQQVELANRLSTALAAFRLEMAKTGDYDKAVKYAYDTTLNSQFDYSAEGKARMMRQGGGIPLAKLVMQFRNFQQGMLYTLVSNAKRAYENPAERKEALGALAYMTLASGLSAGAMGLPFASVYFLAANMFRDPDDPEGDAETAFRNALMHMTGDKTVADTLAKGIPAAFGVDISKRIGLGDVASVFPMANFTGRTGADQEGKLLAAAMGPAAGMAARMYDGAVAATNGDFGTAVEKATPKVVADLAKAMRYADTGMTDLSGDPTGTDLSGKDVLARALGFSPTKEADYFEGTKAIKSTETAIKARESKVAEAYKDGLRSGDMSRARRLIEEFNADHPENTINAKKETEWRKAERDNGKNRQPGSGVKLGTKTQAKYNHLADFAS